MYIFFNIHIHVYLQACSCKFAHHWKSWFAKMHHQELEKAGDAFHLLDLAPFWRTRRTQACCASQQQRRSLFCCVGALEEMPCSACPLKQSCRKRKIPEPKPPCTWPQHTHCWWTGHGRRKFRSQNYDYGQVRQQLWEQSEKKKSQKKEDERR